MEITVLRPAGPELPRPQFDRAAATAALRATFDGLSDDEFQVVCRRMCGVRLIDISGELDLSDEAVEADWVSARRKLRAGLFPQPAPAAPPSAVP